jgi:OOP family OmpA-OmpF porin
MKKIMLLLFVFAAANAAVQAQVLEKLGKKVERKVNQRIERKTDRAIDKSLDKLEKGVSEKPAGEKKITDQQQDKFSAQSKFDFVPGETILFFDNFEKDAKGDFPAKWNTTGSGEIVNITGQDGKWLKVPDNTLSFPEIKSPLPENFTIEFDLYYPKGISRPPATFGFTEVKAPTQESVRYKKLFYFRISQSVDNNIGYSTSIYSGREITHDWPANEMAGKDIHVSVAVNRQRIRLYMNEEKIFDLPKAFEVNSLRNNFHFRSAVMVPAPKEGFYVSNLRIAAAATDARSQLLKSGKYSTTGIYFNTGSAVIKPASHGILMEIAQALTENPEININIIGHTDNDGNEVANLKLSKLRAEAVRIYLSNTFSINAKRINTDGKGATQPVGSNQTAEGKAQNRRVEFIHIK